MSAGPAGGRPHALTTPPHRLPEHPPLAPIFGRIIEPRHAPGGKGGSARRRLWPHVGCRLVHCPPPAAREGLSLLGAVRKHETRRTKEKRDGMFQRARVRCPPRADRSVSATRQSTMHNGRIRKGLNGQACTTQIHGAQDTECSGAPPCTTHGAQHTECSCTALWTAPPPPTRGWLSAQTHNAMEGSGLLRPRLRPFALRPRRARERDRCRTSVIP